MSLLPARARRLLLAAAALAAVFAARPAPGQERALLWQVGTADNDDREFALAPGGYSGFRDDGFFVVGQSDPKRDWPYVQPGPADGWAGGRRHTFTVLFGLKAAPTAGECRLLFDLVDTQKPIPPELRVEINGKAFRHPLPPGAGDDSVQGDPSKGREEKFAIPFPAGLLRAGTNEVAITTLSGSWILYDRLAMEAPASAVLQPIQGSVVHDIRSLPALVRKEGKLYQTIELTVRHFGEPADGLVRVAGAEPVPIKLAPGAQKIQVPIPAVEAEAQVKVEAGGKVIASAEQTLKPVRKWEIHFLPHSHVDIGYTAVQTEVLRRQWSHLEAALAAIKKTADYPPEARFKWNVEVLWAVDAYLRQAPPEKQQEIVDAIKAGSIELDGLYGNELTGLCRPEELARITASAVRLSRRCGVPVVSAMISDVPGYTWGIVPVLAQSGVKYFSVGPNQGDRIGYTLSAWGDKPFWWTSPSGKERILCWVAGGGYSSFHGGGLARAGEKAVWDCLNRLEAADYPYDLVQVRYSTGGDNGPPDPGICDFVRQWNETYAYPKLVVDTTSALFRDFEKRYGDSLPRAAGDFTPYWEDGAASSARETAVNRDAAERLVQAETLYAMLAPKAYPAADFADAWSNVLLYDEHTWGAYNSISQPDSQFVKDQWQIKQAFALDGEKDAQKLLGGALAAAGPPQPGAIDVFNTCSFPRTDLVLLSREQAPGDRVLDDAGHAVPSQRLSTGELAFVARDVPPFAARRYRLASGPAAGGGRARADKLTLSNGLVSAALDGKTGAIVRLKGAGADVADPKAGLNDYLYVPGRDPKAAQHAGPAKITVKERGPLVASLLVESDAPGCNRLTREVRVVDGLDRVEIINVVDKKAVREKEGVHFAFPFKVPGGVVRMDIPWAVERPETDQLPGSCKNWFTVQRWVDVSNKGAGVTLATPDAPLVEMGAITAETPWIKTLEPSQTLFSYVMNNYWHTNYKATQEGPTTFRYALRPHRAYRPEEAARLGIACSQPLVIAPACGALRKAPFLRVSPESVLVSALKPSEDGKAWIVRLFGAGSKPVKATLTWPAPHALYASDLTEKQGDPITGPVDVPAMGMVTVRASAP